MPYLVGYSFLTSRQHTRSSVATTAVLSPLSVALREGTRGEHETAERSGFVELLLAGRLDRAAYADLAARCEQASEGEPVRRLLGKEPEHHPLGEGSLPMGRHGGIGSRWPVVRL